MMYRLYRRTPVESGKWYFLAPCKKCGKTVYLLDDTSMGARPVKFTGEGTISAPCLRCTHENEYQPHEVKAGEANETLPGARPDRVKPSKSSRKPLWIAYPKAQPIIGVGYIEDRPKAATIVARIITGWADIEVQCAGLLATLMGTELPAAAALFGSLRSGRVQHEALNAAARAVLNEADYELFSALMSWRSALESERNDLAHGRFGVAVSIPDHIVWVAQNDFHDYAARAPTDPGAFERFRKKQFVYELGTLERIAQEIEELFNQIQFFGGYLGAARNGPDGQLFRAERYPQLCNQPHIRRALERIRTAKASGKAPHKEPRAKKKAR